ncbi:MAG TPA: two-component regulator propeller domain-containing protein, partial [Chitinophagaceae bacterium]|nr:two-component regulator propeller domain-containing protein [Chitinophagaceae bacterium]
MKPHLYLYFFIPLFLFSKENFAQKTPIDFNLVTGLNGIGIGKVNGITQDKRGYMWFCDQGNSCLTRYDGYRMKTYRNDSKDGNSIAPSNFECLAADSSGNIWLPVNEGVDKLDPLTGISTHYRFNKKSDCKGGFIASILVDHSNSIWLGTYEGLYNLDQKTGNFTCYSHHDNDQASLSCNIIRALYEDHEGTIWVGTGLPFDTLKEGGLNKFNRTTGKFTRYMHDVNNPHSLINDKIRAIFEDSRGVFWVGTQGDGLHIMNRKTEAFERLTYDPAHPEKLSRPPIAKGDLLDHITFITEDISGALWIGTYKQGIVRYDPLTKKIMHFIADEFPDSTTWAAFTSRDGTLWIATENSTLLYRVDPFHKSITHISTGETANSFAEDKNGYLWAGTEGNGIFKFDQNNNAIAHFTHNPLDPLSLPENHNMISAASNDDKIWAGSYNGIRKIDEHTTKFYKVSNNSDLFKDSSQNGCVSVLEDKKGITWFATWGRGLLKYNSSDSTVKQFLPDPKDSASISSNRLNHLLEDKQGRLWIIGLGGIHRMDRKTEKFKNYLPESFIGSIYQDSRNNIWAGTQRGLFRYDEENDVFSPFFDPYSALYFTGIGGIIEDNNQNLWLNSNSAIIKLNPVTRKVFIHSDKYGIGGNSMAVWAKAYKNKKGQLLYGYGDGFGIFYPQELEEKTDLKIILTDLFINTVAALPGKESFLQKPVEEISDLDLKYNQNNIAFNFSALDYRDPESIQYFTMLEGYENTWRQVTGETTSYYFNLPRRKYTYHIKAIIKDGTEAEKIITIIVNPP